MAPLGPGIGATQLECRVGSLIRAAGMLAMSTVGQPMMIMPGPPGTQPGSMHGMVWSVMRAAGKSLIDTVPDPVTMKSGGPTQIALSVTRACGREFVCTVIEHGGMMGPPTCGTGPLAAGHV